MSYFIQQITHMPGYMAKRSRIPTPLDPQDAQGVSSKIVRAYLIVKEYHEKAVAMYFGPHLTSADLPFSSDQKSVLFRCSRSKKIA